MPKSRSSNRYRKGMRKYRLKQGPRYIPKGLVSNSVPSGMPTIKRANLRYVENIEITSTVGSVAEYKFRCNSIFDPNETGTGHQPMGSDQWAVLFNHYTVLGSKISVSAVQNGGAVNPGFLGIYLTDGHSNPYTTASEFIEARKGTFTTITADQSRIKTLRQKFSTKKFFNVSDVKDNSELKALVTANPVDDAIFNIWYQTADGTTNSVNLMVTIDYIVEYSEPKDLTQS